MTVMGYRTRDGLADYGFSIEFQHDIGWRIYIIFLPSQEDHDNDLHLPYQADDGKRRYVSWSEKIDSLGDAKMVAELWAELAHRHQQAREKSKHYAELIERYLRTQEERKASTHGADRPGDTVEAGGTEPEPQDRGPAVPQPSVSKESLSNIRESDQHRREVA